MITEDYCDFEISKLLKEKGFDEPCRAYWHKDENRLRISCSMHALRNITNPCIFGPAAPTLQMAMKWLREVHKIHITVYPYGEHSCDNYQFDTYKNREYLLSKDEGYMTNEQAIEAAIKYCLENLV